MRTTKNDAAQEALIGLIVCMVLAITMGVFARRASAADRASAMTQNVEIAQNADALN